MYMKINAIRFLPLITMHIFVVIALFSKNNFDLLGAILFIITGILISISAQKNNFSTVFYLSCMNFLLLLPFMWLISSDSQHPLIFKGTVDKLHHKTFFVILITNILIFMMTYKFKKYSKNGNFKYVNKFPSLFPLIIHIIITTIYNNNLQYSLYFTNRYELFFVERSSLIIFIEITIKVFPSFIAFGILNYIINSNKIQVQNIVIFICVFIYSFMLNNPTNSPRIISLSGLIICFMPLIIHKNLINKYIILMPMFIFIVLPLTSIIRFGLEEATIENYNRLITSGEFSAILLLNDAIIANLDVDQHTGILVISAIGTIIPRTIWLVKSNGIGEALANDLNYTFQNVAVPPIFNFIGDFSLIGIILYSVFISYTLNICKKIQYIDISYYKKQISLIFFVLIPLSCRGDFSLYFITLYSMICSVTLILIFSKIRFRGRTNQ